MSWSYRKLAFLIVALGVAGPFVNSWLVPEAWDSAYGVLVGWVALLAIVVYVRRARPGGSVWPLLAASVALGAASTMLSSLVGEGRASATPHVGDAILLLSSLLLAVAMVRMLVAREPGRLVGLALNADDAEPRLSTAVMLGIAALVGPFLIGAQDLANHLSYILAAWLGGGAVSALVVTRFWLLLRRARSLTHDLDGDFAERGRLLLESEDRYRQLVEQVPAVIYDAHVDEDGWVNWQYVTPQCATILGIDADALYADPEAWIAAVHAEDRAGVRSTLAHHDVAGAATEFRFMRPDGEEIWIRNTATTVSVDGTGRCVQGLMFDITQAKHAISERERMEVELRLAQKLEAVGQLAAGIAHEINTPIQFIGDSVGFLHGAFGDLMALVGVYDELKRSAEHGMPAPELVQRVSDAELDADVEYLTERVPAAFKRTIDGVQRVATIVRAMREFGHPPTADLSPVDVNAVIENTLIVATSEYKYVADVTCELGELPTVLCNCGDINQVMLNLIVNAAHAIAEAVGESGERGTITIRTTVQDETVRISVADTGTGIPAAIAERIYDPFFTTKAVGRGTGQGLAITRTIVERHDGTISFDTIAGAGTTFHIVLPTRAPVPADHTQRIAA
jgi:PAS domain S-box-containing protein